MQNEIIVLLYKINFHPQSLCTLAKKHKQYAVKLTPAIRPGSFLWYLLCNSVIVTTIILHHVTPNALLIVLNSDKKLYYNLCILSIKSTGHLFPNSATNDWEKEGKHYAAPNLKYIPLAFVNNYYKNKHLTFYTTVPCQTLQLQFIR